MKPPREDRKADPDAAIPDFDALAEPADVVRAGQTYDRIYTTVLQLNEPTPVAEIADRSDCSPDAARKYLQRFEDIGIVYQVSEDPRQYVVDRDYLRWRRANRLSKEYREPELVQRLQDVTDEIQSYRERYDAQSPSEITISEVADRSDRTVADVWKEVSAWETAERRRNILEDALEKRRQDVEDGRIPDT